MTIRVGDQTISLYSNYLGTGRSVLLSSAANGDVQVLAVFIEPPKNTTLPGTIRVLRNYAFRFANSKGKPLLDTILDEQVSQ